MSCLKSTAPINLSKNKKVSSCTDKCKLQFSYSDSNCSVTNKGDHLLIGYDNSAKDPIIFNNDELNVSQIRIYRPSLHTFEDEQTDAEMVIFHSSTGRNLLICIPMVLSDQISTSSLSLSHIIKKTLKNAPNEDEKTQINFNGQIKFNLNDYVKKHTPYFAYTGTLMYPPCSGTYNYIVFHPEHAKINISPKDLSNLKKLISSSDYSTKDNTYSFNETGAMSLGVEGDDIYIKCNPTGEDGEILETKNIFEAYSSSGSTTPLNWNDLIKNPVFEIVLGVIIVSIVVLALRSAFNALKRPSVAQPAPWSKS